MGHKGGPGGALWIDPVSTGTRDVFRVETGQLILWTCRDDLSLEYAVDLIGPWVTYTGPMITIGSQNAVLVNSTEPRRFFRLVRFP
jgi:hypothetical protein